MPGMEGECLLQDSNSHSSLCYVQLGSRLVSRDGGMGSGHPELE